jgi:glycosyltransferase involved in cell wall biosynthesis
MSKIVFFHPYALSPHGANGGGANATIFIAEGLVKLGYDISIIALLDCPNCVVEKIQYENFNPEVEDTISINASVLAVVVYDNKLKQINRIKLNHDCKKVVMYHNSIVDDGDLDLKKMFREWADIISVDSDYAKYVVHKWGIQKHKIMVSNPALSDFMIDSDTKITRDDYKLIFVGAIIPDKGFEVAIKAVNQLHKIDNRYKLYLSGDAALGTTNIISINDLKQKYENDYIKFLGRLDGRSIIDLYASSGMILIPSKHEAFGKVSIEAQLFGCIPIANDIGGLTSTIEIGESGFCIKDIDADKIAAAATDFMKMSGPERQLWRNNAKKNASKFDNKRIAGKFIKDINKVYFKNKVVKLITRFI